MADIKWIKIKTDIFDDEKIAVIEMLPDADAIIVIWFKLLCLAGKSNNGGVFLLNDKIPYTEEMLSAIFKRNLSTIRLALSTFEQFGMIEVLNGVITIPTWEKHQSLDKYEARKEMDRERQRKHREEKRQLICGVSRDSHATVTGNVSLSISNNKYISNKKTDIENIGITKSIDIREYKPDDRVKEIVEYLNEKAGTKYKLNSRNTAMRINARLNEGFTVDDFKTVISRKTKEWLGTDYQKFLRPETLFGNKFESYLNAPDEIEKESFEDKLSRMWEETGR